MQTDFYHGLLKPGDEPIVTFPAAADGQSPARFLKTITCAGAHVITVSRGGANDETRGGPPWIFVER
jgi:hypothetical protein